MSTVKSTRLKSIWITINLILAISVSGCISGSSMNSENNPEQVSAVSEASINSPVVIKFLNGGANKAELFSRVTNYFNESQNEVEVVVETDTVNYNVRLMTLLALNQGPDIFTHITGREMKSYVEAGYLMDLTGEKFLDQINSKNLESAIYDGKVYMLPLDTHIWGIFYNRKIFKDAGIRKLPETIEELKDAVIKVKQLNYIPFSMLYRDAWSPGQIVTIGASPLISFAAAEKGRDKDWTFDRPDFRRFLDVLDIIRSNSQPNFLNTDILGQYTLFAKEKAAMMPSGNWALMQIRELNPQLDAGMFPCPVSDNPGDTLIPADYALGFNVYAHTKHIDAVRKFLNFFVDSNGPARIYYESIGVPTAVKTKNIKYDPMTDEVQKAMDEGRSIRWFHNLAPEGFANECWDLTKQYLEVGEMTKQQFISKLDRFFKESYENETYK